MSPVPLDPLDNRGEWEPREWLVQLEKEVISNLTLELYDVLEIFVFHFLTYEIRNTVWCLYMCDNQKTYTCHSSLNILSIESENFTIYRRC